MNTVKKKKKRVTRKSYKFEVICNIKLGCAIYIVCDDYKCDIDFFNKQVN